MIECYGPYFGQTLSFAECEVLAIANIDRRLLAGESKLYGDKWFDYRPLHPTMATYLCVHHYNRAYGDFMGQCFDHGKRFMVGFKGKDFMNSREKQSFWKLRQKIDALGVRYDFFMREAMKWCIEHGWRQPPRPAHIAANDELIVDVSNRWAMECRAKIQFAVAPRYAVEQFVGGADQLAYEDYLITNIMQRPHPRFALHAALYVYGALRIEAALARLPDAAIEGAMQIDLG
jgi:hypothetical protein